MLDSNSTTTWYQYVPYNQANDDNYSNFDVTFMINSQTRIHKRNIFIRDRVSGVGTKDTKILAKEYSPGYDSVRNLQQVIDDIRLLSNSTANQPLRSSVETSVHGLPTYCEYLQNSIHIDNKRNVVKKKKSKDGLLLSHKNR